MLFYYSCPIFPLCTLPSIPPSAPTPTVNPNTVVHVHGSFIHVLSPALSPSFHHYPHYPSPLVAVSLFHVSMTLVLFCLLVCFVHKVPIIGEIIWYLSFTCWLISLSIIFSSSIHIVVKGNFSIFFTIIHFENVLLFSKLHIYCF